MFYIIVTIYLNLVSSLGWMAIVAFIPSIILGAVTSVFVTLTSVKLLKNSVEVVVFPYKIFYFLLFSQFLMISFNVVGADGPVGFFYEMYFTQFYWDSTYPTFDLSLVFIFILVYIVLHIYFLKKLLFSKQINLTTKENLIAESRSF